MFHLTYLIILFGVGRGILNFFKSFFFFISYFNLDSNLHAISGGIWLTWYFFLLTAQYQLCLCISDTIYILILSQIFLGRWVWHSRKNTNTNPTSFSSTFLSNKYWKIWLFIQTLETRNIYLANYTEQV